MSRVEELQRSIQELTPDEFAQIARHVHALEQERWDYQLDRDAAAGKLDSSWLKRLVRTSAQVS